MKHMLTLFVFMLLFAASGVKAQQDTAVIYLDSTMHLTTKQDAVYGEAIVHQGKMYFTALVDIAKREKLYTGCYKDKGLSVQQGLFEFYTHNVLTMRGSYQNGKQVGIWKKWGLDSLLVDSVVFKETGAMELEAKFSYHQNKKLWRYVLENEEGEKISREFDTSGATVSEGKFTGDDGETVLYYPDGKIKKHLVFKDGAQTLFEFFDEKGVKYDAAGYAEYIKSHPK